MAMKLDSYLQLFLSSPAKVAVRSISLMWIRMKNVSRFCHAKPIVIMSGRFLGPTVYTREGDRVLVNVTNYAQYNIFIHWHVIYIHLQSIFMHNVHICIYILNQLVATIYGAIVIMPKEGRMFSLPQPYGETKIILGEWWNKDVEILINQANKLELPPPTTDSIPNTVLPSMPKLPAPNNTNVALRYNNCLRNLNSQQFQAKVPLKVNRHLFYTVGLGANLCSSCQNGTQLTVGLLQAHYFHIKGVFKTDFLDRPPVLFYYTGVPLTVNLGTSLGTRLLVLQDTNLLTVESHPFYIYGFNFFVVGSGVGNFDPSKDPTKFKLVNPPERNTIGVPTRRWTTIRFRADNPGVWFMHCHPELHTMCGLKMAIVVESGKSLEESIIPPLNDLPLC
ncbi:hypothetical protein GOBAR_DD01213 [Gossypium barbadense]|nr:hypothetical protein GOBAR_DD01213 [Gossypium barbadense]